jgi:hypothetical protein
MGFKFSDLPPRVQQMVRDSSTPVVSPKPSMPHKLKGVMNNLEKDFHVSYLSGLEQTGEIGLIRYEGITLPIAHRCTYTPDYIAETPEGQTLLWEVKAPHRFKNAGILKLKFAAAQYPEYQFYLAEKKNKKWTVKLIPTWSRNNPSTDPEPEEVE